MEFRTSVDRLLNQVGHWEQSRWWAPIGDGTRGDAMFALVQRLADLGADAEQRPRRAVPRVGDLVLPDQLRVMADDLVAAADADTLDRATAAVEELRHAIDRARAQEGSR